MKKSIKIVAIVCLFLLVVLVTIKNDNINKLILKHNGSDNKTSLHNYINDNKELKQQLNEANNVIVTLEELLEYNESTNISITNTEKNYVVKTLVNDGDVDDTCIDIRDATNWNESLSKPIYICID